MRGTYIRRNTHVIAVKAVMRGTHQACEDSSIVDLYLPRKCDTSYTSELVSRARQVYLEAPRQRGFATYAETEC